MSITRTHFSDSPDTRVARKKIKYWSLMYKMKYIVLFNLFE